MQTVERLMNRYQNWRHGFDCRRAVDLATDYVEGALDPADQARYERHLVRCEACRGYLAQMRSTIAVLGSLDPDQVPPDVLAELIELHRRYRDER